MKKIYLTKPFFDDDEFNAVRETLESGWVAGQGPKGIKLSEAVRNYINVEYAVPVVNCTAGLHLALLTLGIKKGDEVLVSDFTFPATGHAVMFCGAKPVFVDVCLDTYNMNPDKIESKITEKTKAIIVVHCFGQVADMDRITATAERYNLKIIEDAACSLGAKYKGKNAGNFSDIAAFSFHARKNVTSGEGGIVTTDNKEYADILSSLSCFGMESAFKRQQNFKIPTFDLPGYNYKLSDINAAIAIEQLKKYPRLLEKKRLLVHKYNELLQNNEFVKIPVVAENNLHVYQTYAVGLNPEIDRNKIIISLREDNIQTQIGMYASHILPVYKSSDKCPDSLYLFRNTLALPLYYELEIEDVEVVVERLNVHINKQLSK